MAPEPFCPPEPMAQETSFLHTYEPLMRYSDAMSVEQTRWRPMPGTHPDEPSSRGGAFCGLGVIRRLSHNASLPLVLLSLFCILCAPTGGECNGRPECGT